MFNEKPSREEILAATQVNCFFEFLFHTHTRIRLNRFLKCCRVCETYLIYLTIACSSLYETPEFKAPSILGASLNKTKKGVRLNAAETKFFWEVSFFSWGERGGAE